MEGKRIHLFVPPVTSDLRVDSFSQMGQDGFSFSGGSMGKAAVSPDGVARLAVHRPNPYCSE